jgi:hypothetical protein
MNVALIMAHGIPTLLTTSHFNPEMNGREKSERKKNRGETAHLVFY